MTLTPDVSKLNFVSNYPVDKVVAENKALPLIYTVAAYTEVTNSIPNPYGKKCFTTMSWSLDGSNYYPAQAKLSNAFMPSANAWADATNVYFYLDNSGMATSSTFYIIYALDTIL